MRFLLPLHRKATFCTWTPVQDRTSMPNHSTHLHDIIRRFYKRETPASTSVYPFCSKRKTLVNIAKHLYKDLLHLTSHRPPLPTHTLLQALTSYPFLFSFSYSRFLKQPLAAPNHHDELPLLTARNFTYSRRKKTIPLYQTI